MGKKYYYYLRASKKNKNKQITKDIAYLGNSLIEAKKNLEGLGLKKEEIRKSYKKISLMLEKNYFLEKIKEQKLKHDEYLKDDLEEVEACKYHFSKNFKKLDSLTKEEIINNFSMDFAYNTTSIEGNTISLKEAKYLLEEGKTPANKDLREIYDLQNTQKVFLSIFKIKKKLSHKLIQEIHKDLLRHVDLRIGYRIHDVRVFKSNFDSSPGIYVKTDMELLLDWYEKNKKLLHPFVLATIFHHKFEKIHPFADGNGRTGRMLLNYILMQNNYPPVIISKIKRVEYLKNLSFCDAILLNETKKDYFKLVSFVAKESIASYWNFFL